MDSATDSVTDSATDNVTDIVEVMQMDKEMLISKLSAYIDMTNYINVIMKKNTAENFYCIPIAVSGKLLLCLDFFDFMPNGYTIVRLDDIEKIIYNDACEYYESIVKKEGALLLVDAIPKISIESWEDAFMSLKEHDLIIIVDIGKEDATNVGKVIKATRQNVSMICVSTIGVWDSDEWHEPISNVTRIQFSNHYTNIYTKYCNYD